MMYIWHIYTDRQCSNNAICYVIVRFIPKEVHDGKQKENWCHGTFYHPIFYPPGKIDWDTLSPWF